MHRQVYRHGHFFQEVKSQRKILLGLICLIFLSSVVFMTLNSKRQTRFFTPSLDEKWNSMRPLVQISPTIEYINGSEIIWQIPESPKASLFIAHGCHGKAVNFWDRSPNCLNCIGLPEERLTVLHALKNRYAVITISSANVCWSFPKEKEKIKRILNWWLREKNLDKLPVVALGASSGGYFISALATEYRFASLTLMIAEGVVEAFEMNSNYPPTLFIHMPKDRKRATRIAEAVERLRNKGVDVAEVECREFPLTPTFLSNRIPALDEKTSMRIFEVFKEEGILNKENYMAADGRSINWKKPLKMAKVLSEIKNEWEMHIQEELNLAFGYHEMTSLQSSQIFHWFDTHLH